MDHLGQPMPHALVALSTGGHRLTTFTDAKGNYRFYGAASGHGTLSVLGHEFPVTVGPGLAAGTLRMS